MSIDTSLAKTDERPKKVPRWSLALLLSLTLLAASLRFWNLHNLPPGLSYDESFNGVDARSLLTDGKYPLFFSGNNGREPLYIYLQALSVAFFGPTAYALRFTSALIGTLTIPLVYWLVSTLLQPATQANKERPSFSAWLPLLAAAGVAVGLWPLSLSRLGFRAVLLPPLSALAMLYFWKGWTQHRGRDFGWAGFWLAASLYSYTAARLLPLVILLFVLMEGMLGLGQRWGHPCSPGELWRRQGRGLLWLLLVAAICALPLLYTFYQHPRFVAARTADVSIFSPELEGMSGTVAARVWTNLVATARAFYDRGDPNLHHNLPGQPLHDPLLALLFSLGCLVALFRLRQPHIRLIVLWFLVMALPTLLSTQAPHSLRLAGVLPPLALLYALGGEALLGLCARRNLHAAGGGILLLLILALGGGWTGYAYFVRWAAAPGLGATFDLDKQLGAEVTAAKVAALQPGAALAVTRSLYQTPHMRFAIGPIPRQDLPPGAAITEEAAVQLSLLRAEPTDPTDSAFLLRSVDGQIVATWLSPIAGTTGGQLFSSPSAQPLWPQIALSPLTDTLFAADNPNPLHIRFANGMLLLGYELAPDRLPLDATDPAFLLRTFWRLDPAYPPPDANGLDIFAHLQTVNGQAQKNGPIAGNYPLGLWQPGEIVTDQRLFPLPATTQPGKAYFEMGLYVPDGVQAGQRIDILDDAGKPASTQITFGVVAIGDDPPQAELSDLQPLGVWFVDRLELRGWRAALDPDNRQQLLVELGWQAHKRVATDYTLFVHLLDRNGAIIAQRDQPPGGVENPTTMWLPGETTRTRLTLDLPPALVLDEHLLRVGLYEPVGGRQLPITQTPSLPTNPAPLGQTYLLLPLE